MRIDAHAVADIAVMAGAALRTHRGRAREIRAPKKDFLTSADLQAETYILAALSEFGDIPVLSEETGGEEKHKAFPKAKSSSLPPSRRGHTEKHRRASGQFM
ncbi:MAG: hypothetical protein UY02_C0034G0004 [Candidatus Giovannonibacteria bacterium GW2011_GWB1_47_6b]|uniref:Uncharacterized protein n=1 Tax=Candidatus Giovannonibacteria bacterium GW2011_GWB1_47_6b TaxID=1618655 RepID=A0A0G1VD28_9BACT|nr:MAG: hypothetical protein UY02_C0034G0004 [Candidatus Giovannonibacteria bacterium GW2011_GWB1_47_6b]